jgi:hypothetical protein
MAEAGTVQQPAALEVGARVGEAKEHHGREWRGRRGRRWGGIEDGW